MTDILPIGGPCQLKCSVGLDGITVPAIITGVTIRECGYVIYEVVWWSGADRKSAWVASCEVEPANNNRQQIGFNGGERR